MDIFSTKSEDFKLGVFPTRLGILIAVIIAFALSLILSGSIISQETAIFYGICAAVFLAVILLHYTRKELLSKVQLQVLFQER